MSVDEAILTQYALGTLDDAEYKKVQREISASPLLQKELSAIRSVLQNVALAEKPVNPSDRLRNKVLDSIQEKTRFSGFTDRIAELFDLDKKKSQRLLATIDHDLDNAWEKTFFPGVKIMKFTGGPKVVSATCGFVQVNPKKLFPAHQHTGNELVLVLQGQARDDNDKVLAAGDIIHNSTGSSHSFRIISDESFIFAVVLYKENKWLLLKTLIDLLRIKKQ